MPLYKVDVGEYLYQVWEFYIESPMSVSALYEYLEEKLKMGLSLFDELKHMDEKYLVKHPAEPEDHVLMNIEEVNEIPHNSDS